MSLCSIYFKADYIMGNGINTYLYPEYNSIIDNVYTIIGFNIYIDNEFLKDWQNKSIIFGYLKNNVNKYSTVKYYSDFTISELADDIYMGSIIINIEPDTFNINDKLSVFITSLIKIYGEIIIELIVKI